MAGNLIKGYRLHNDQSLAASFNSDAVTVTTLDTLTFIVNTSSVSDNTGTFSLQKRIVDSSGRNASAWTSLTLSSTPALADADSNFEVIVTDLTPGEYRLAFTAAGSVPDGTCDIWVSGSQSGGR